MLSHGSFGLSDTGTMMQGNSCLQIKADISPAGKGYREWVGSNDIGLVLGNFVTFCLVVLEQLLSWVVRIRLFSLVDQTASPKVYQSVGGP